MFKIIYAEKRRPEMSPTQFVRRWRYHAGMAMLDAHFWDPMVLYVQNDALRGLDGTDEAYDCVGELFYPTQADVDASLATPGIDAILADGDEFFSRRDQILQVAEHHQLRDGRPGALRIFVFARAPQGMTRSDFTAHYTAALEARLGTGGALDRLALQVALAAATTDEASYAVIADASFDSVADARLGWADWQDMIAADPALADHLAIASRSYILYDSNYDKGTAA